MNVLALQNSAGKNKTAGRYKIHHKRGLVKQELYTGIKFDYTEGIGYSILHEFRPFGQRLSAGKGRKI